MKNLAAALLVPFLACAARGVDAEKLRLAVDVERTDEDRALSAGDLDGLAFSENAGGRAGPVLMEGVSCGTYVSPLIDPGIPFDDVLISWNILAPEGSGWAVSMRFAREPGGPEGPWYHFGRFGKHPRVEGALTKDEAGGVEIDCFSASHLLRAYRYRVHLTCESSGRPAIHRISVTVSNLTGDAALHAKLARRSPVPAGPIARLPVPFRSQKWEAAEISGRICSPTSLSMVLQFRGVHRPTAEVCQRAFDADNDIYGNWPANVQAAYSYGIPGKLARFRTWDDARIYLAAGQPIIMSIRDREGVLKGAPYPKTNGHLLVLVGIDADGNPLVNDPAAMDELQGRATYDRAQMEKVWFGAGGLGYVLETRSTPRSGN